MKSLLLFAGLYLATVCTAAEQQLELLAGKAETQVFYLACQQLQITPASLRLTGADGVEVPFSLDWRYELPPDIDRNYGSSGRFVSKPDGFYSKWQAPASENRFANLGWLSFQRRQGVEKYILTYTTGETGNAARPNPAVRPWWIELMRDPELQNLKQLTFKDKTLTAHPEGGVKFSQSFFWPQRCYLLDEQLKGRRLLAMTRVANCGGNFNVPFYNAVLKKNSVINCYFVAEEPSDFLVEGRVDNRPGDFFRSRRGGLSFRKSATEKDGRMWFFHLQSPPENGGIDIRLNSALFNLGDRARLSIAGFERELMYQVRPGVARVENWEPEFAVRAELQSQAGQLLKTYNSASFLLTDLTAGNYSLAVTLHSQRKIPEVIAAKNFVFELQVGPDWH